MQPAQQICAKYCIALNSCKLCEVDICEMVTLILLQWCCKQKTVALETKLDLLHKNLSRSLLSYSLTLKTLAAQKRNKKN